MTDATTRTNGCTFDGTCRTIGHVHIGGRDGGHTPTTIDHQMGRHGAIGSSSEARGPQAETCAFCADDERIADNTPAIPPSDYSRDAEIRAAMERSTSDELRTMRDAPHLHERWVQACDEILAARASRFAS